MVLIPEREEERFSQKTQNITEFSVHFCAFCEKKNGEAAFSLELF
jgi:hypothetical protein